MARRTRVGLVGDRETFGEGGAQQALLHLRLQPVIFGQVEQPVGVEGVAAADEVEPELQAVSGRALGHLLAGLFGLGDRHAVLAGQMLGMGSSALRGRVRVELEGPVGDRDLAGWPKEATARSNRRLPM